jgi:hypothetical protein
MDRLIEESSIHEKLGNMKYYSTGIAGFLLLTLVVMVGIAPALQAGATDGSCCQGSRGDINGSGLVDLPDLSALASFLTGGGYTPPCTGAADVNGSGGVNLADLSTLVYYLVNSGFVLPLCYTVDTVDATSYLVPAYYSFSKRDTVRPGTGDSLWDISFERTVIGTNSGVSADVGDLRGIALNSRTFVSVSSADTVGQTWATDTVAYFINHWLSYDSIQHVSVCNGNVYTLMDATGHHFVKLRIDSLVGAAAPSNMGTVYLTYFYNPIADSPSLVGGTSEVAIPVGTDRVYFSFASGTVVTPADPKSSTAWDLVFNAYTIGQNSGPNGPSGVTASFEAFQYLADPTDIGAVHDVYVGNGSAPMVPDRLYTVFDNWYQYDAQTHIIRPLPTVYLLKRGSKLYKMGLDSYYLIEGNSSTAGHYIFRWQEL